MQAFRCWVVIFPPFAELIFVSSFRYRTSPSLMFWFWPRNLAEVLPPGFGRSVGTMVTDFPEKT